MSATATYPVLKGWPRHWPAGVAPLAESGRDWPRVTLVTPCRNQAPFIEDAILSVLNQGYPHLEYMVFDAGSDDGSAEIIGRFSSRLAYWESQLDRGQSHAINKGWARASGRYVWWLNGDDMLAPGALFHSVESLEAQPGVDLVYGDLVNVDDRGRPLSLYPSWEFDLADFLARGRHVTQPGALMRREVLERIGSLDESLHYLMDTDYWIRLALAGGTLVHLPSVLALFRVHQQAKTQTGSMAAVEERYLLNRRIYASPDLPTGVRVMRAQITSRMHLECARAYLKLGAFRSTLSEAGLAVKAWPRRLLDTGLWWHLALGMLGLAVGQRVWLRLRQCLRQSRRIDDTTLGTE